jgi:hypothetical protein
MRINVRKLGREKGSGEGVEESRKVLKKEGRKGSEREG